MKVHIDTKLKQAYVVSSSDIEKLWMYLEEHVGTVTASMTCSDDGTREFDDLEKLTAYDNPSTKQIVALDIKSHSADWEKYVDVQFSDKVFSSIDISIKAQDQTASEIRERISDILDGTKPWYGRLALVHRSDLGMTVVISTAVCILIIAAAYIWEDFSDFEFMERTLLVTTSVIPILIGLGWLRARFLPVCCFTLGQGEHRYRRLVNAHKIIFGLLATLITSLVVGAVYR